MRTSVCARDACPRDELPAYCCRGSIYRQARDAKAIEHRDELTGRYQEYDDEPEPNYTDQIGSRATIQPGDG